MLNIGRARWKVEVQFPSVSLDALGAPTTAWSRYAELFVEIENESVDQAESSNAGPRKELSKTFTMIARCHPSQTFTPAMRVLADEGSIYEILACRFNERRTTAYLDVRSGINAGGIP